MGNEIRNSFLIRTCDLIECLQQDHREIKKAMSDLRKAKSVDDLISKADAFRRLVRYLERHEQAEEIALYEPFVGKAEFRTAILEGFEEHRLLERLVQEIAALAPHDDRWSAKVEVLLENLEFHLREEETDLFPQIEKHQDQDSLEMLARRFLEARRAQERGHGPYLSPVPVGRRSLNL